MSAEQGPTAGPYQAAADTYWRAGWRGLLPTPPHRKAPVPEGWTGTQGAWPSRADVQAWIEDRPAHNIALRLPPSVLGVDVDHYDGKPGGLVLQALEARLGQLPPTWRTTSRDDGLSGIRLYRIPEGLRWPGVLGPGIETIRTEHRYAITWPSIHPTGSTYRWILPDGTPAIGVVPNIDELPDLPAAWIEHFTKGELSTDQPRANLNDQQADAWLTAHATTSGPCRSMTTALERSLADLTTASSRHDAALTGTNRIVWLAGEGHTGHQDALDNLRQAFLKATTGDRQQGAAEAEWERMITGAVRMAAAAHPATTDGDPCADPFHGLIRKDDPWTTTTAPTTSTAPTTPATSATEAASSTTTTVSAPAPAAMAADTSTPEADDATELQIRRNQAAAQELERLRAQRAAQRALEQEDEEQAIADRVRRRILDDKAHTAYRLATEPPAPAFDAGTLADILNRPDDPPMRAEGLIPWEASVLLVAARKTGKTTTLLNYARSLLTGEPFLGDFPVIPLEAHQRVTLLNYEVSAKQVARWAADIGIDPDRFYLVNLRGRRNPLAREDDRQALAQLLRDLNTGALMVDPFGRAYTGESQNDNAEVQRFLVDLDTFTRTDTGATDLILAAHAGWDGERTRGASALEDWPDTIINLTGDEDEGRRYMRALGRDVDVDEDELVMDPITRILTRAGTGARRTSKRTQKTEQAINEIAVLVTRVVNQHPGAMGQNEIKKAIADLPHGDARNVGDGHLGRAIKQAATAQFVIIHESVGPRRGHVIHRRDVDCSHCSDCSRTAPGAVPPPLLPTPVGGSSGSRQSSNGHTNNPEQSHPTHPPHPSQVIHRIIDGQIRKVNTDTGEVIDE